jgi:murein DD-endopeptidase MepM/ murein hydrolase activator NlpD
MKHLIGLVISLVLAAVALPLLAIAALTGAGGPDPACPHPPTSTADTEAGRWDAEQLTNTATIVQVGHTKRVPPWGWVIAVATAIQESQLRNLPHLGPANDHDSIGLFQQRPSQGWGTPEQLADPAHQAGTFYNKLLTIDGWHLMPLAAAAQAVQRSAHPDAYTQHTNQAVHLTSHTAATLGLTTITTTRCTSVSPTGWTQPLPGPVVSGYGPRHGRMHNGVDLAAPRHTIIHAAASGTVTRIRCNAINRHTGRNWGCHRDGHPHHTAGCGWYLELTHPGHITTRYCHLHTRPWVNVGDPIIVGQPIGTVGSTGHSSGPHLHYEVHLGDPNRGPIDPQPWMAQHGAPLGNP